MSWQYARKLLRRERRSLTFELVLREDGVLREVVQLTVKSALGPDGIKAEIKRAAGQHVRAILAARAAAA